MSPWQCFYDENGNLTVMDGAVSQAKTGVVILAGGGELFATPPSAVLGNYQIVKAARGSKFVGGSGRNIVLSGFEPSSSSAESPSGFYQPNEPDVYRLRSYTLEVLGVSSATISDGTDVIAELTTGGTAPVGDYDSTTYGETLFSSSGFTLTAASEGGTPLDPPAASLEVSAGTALTGQFDPLNATTWELVADNDWTIVVATDGTAELRYLSNVVAERSEGVSWRPDGYFIATTYGEDNYNAGEPWYASVTTIGRTPRAGYVYLEIIEDTGVLDAVNGPFFGSLPSPDPMAETYYFPIAVSDGLGGIEQLHTGIIQWP
jgi:hypothetical protein